MRVMRPVSFEHSTPALINTTNRKGREKKMFDTTIIWLRHIAQWGGKIAYVRHVTADHL